MEEVALTNCFGINDAAAAGATAGTAACVTTCLEVATPAWPADDERQFPLELLHPFQQQNHLCVSVRIFGVGVSLVSEQSFAWTFAQHNIDYHN